MTLTEILEIHKIRDDGPDELELIANERAKDLILMQCTQLFQDYTGYCAYFLMKDNIRMATLFQHLAGSVQSWVKKNSKYL